MDNIVNAREELKVTEEVVSVMAVVVLLVVEVVRVEGVHVAEVHVHVIGGDGVVLVEVGAMEMTVLSDKRHVVVVGSSEEVVHLEFKFRL